MCGVVDIKFVILGRKEVMEKMDLTVFSVSFFELSVGYIAMCCTFLCPFLYVLNIVGYVLNINKITFKNISNIKTASLEKNWRVEKLSK